MKKANNNITELVFILDRSGSMGGLESDTIGGFNALIESRKNRMANAMFQLFFLIITARLFTIELTLKTSNL